MSRPAVRKLAPYVPGKTIEEVQRDLGLQRIIKLASNENPLGSSPKAMAALRRIDRLHLYLDDTYPELKEKIAKPYGLHAQNVVLGHGSNELVNIVCETLLESGDEAIMASPSFALYKLAAALQGATPVEVPLREGVHDLEAMLQAITPRTKLVFICDPNNPTGTAITPEDWRAFIARVPENVALLVDQAYREYMGGNTCDAVDLLRERPNAIVLRTMSKIYGLASLRFGYGFADAEMTGWLNRVRLPFNISRPAALGAQGALDDEEFVAKSVASNLAGKTFVVNHLERLGLHVYPSEANFYAVQMPCTATRAYTDLLHRGIIVRSGDALSMPGRLRITIGAPEENGALIEAFEDFLPVWRAAA
ncbi:MAG TPA: histidinol-phosphate transaminase [Candidatus Baltobacteraceae bacterium]|nr:histidinol-phosphate transaminase [Candidatus Baltobacteraceae bacterium]